MILLQGLILQSIRECLGQTLIILLYMEIFSSITKIGVHPAMVPDFHIFIVFFQKSIHCTISRIKHCYYT